MEKTKPMVNAVARYTLAVALFLGLVFRFVIPNKMLDDAMLITTNLCWIFLIIKEKHS